MVCTSFGGSATGSASGAESVASVVLGSVGDVVVDGCDGPPTEPAGCKFGASGGYGGDGGPDVAVEEDAG